ncbi:MAG: SRPBCC family protein [bacterium]
MEKMIEKEIVVNAEIDEVWNAWTTESGVRTFFAPQSRINLSEGGEYEMYFFPDAPEGYKGGEGCKVLKVIPPTHFAFTWNFPPSIPLLRNSSAKTEVSIDLEKISSSTTRVKLTHYGWQEGEDWDSGFDYFTAAWSVVLNRLKSSFNSGPVDWN